MDADLLRTYELRRSKFNVTVEHVAYPLYPELIDGLSQTTYTKL